MASAPKARLGWLALAALLPLVLAARVDATPPSAGYRDYDFGTTVSSTPTGEKPESKLWWNDGSWWGSLWDPGSARYTIRRFDAGSQSWIDTGTPLDPRSSTRADVLWDGSRLYVASHVFTTSAAATSSGNAGRVYRYSYAPASRTYSLDPGFPVVVNASKSETLVLDKDSNGRLWVTWVEAGKVKVNRSLGDDLSWGQPFDLPIQGANVQTDDISSLAAMSSGRIGLLWSNQNDKKMYFSIHLDSHADTQWETRETAAADAVLGQVADDHINLKLSCDPSGAAYAVTKTGLTHSSDPLVWVLRRQANGSWTRHLFGTHAENHTRPVLLIDSDAGVAHVFAMSDKSGRQVIYEKSASLGDLQFPSGLGTPIIDSADDIETNNPTTTKQCVGAATGWLVLASSRSSHTYLHGYKTLAGGTAPVVSTFQPAQGVVGTQVTIGGSRLSGATQVTFNGTPAAGYAVDSDAQIRANVPAGASTGPIRVTTPQGTGTSASNFSVVARPSIASFAPSSGPVGTQVTIAGSRFTGTSSVTFGGTPSTAFTVDDDATIRATVPGGAVSGRIVVSNAAGSATSATDFTVTTGASTLVLRAVHDAQVKSSSPSTNYGQLTTLRIRDLDPAYHFYTKFVVGGLGGPVAKATLRFFVTDDSDQGGSIHAVSNSYANTTTPWTEDGLTWNNAPVIPAQSIATAGPVALNTWVEFDVTSAVPGNGTYSFACRSGSTNSAIVSSDEGTNPPELVLVAATQGAPTDAPLEARAHPAGSAALLQNRPNPFRSATDFFFDLPAAAPVRLVIHDIRGRTVRRLVDGSFSPGQHSARWDGRDDQGLLAPSGMYFARIEVPAGVYARKVILVR